MEKFTNKKKLFDNINIQHNNIHQSILYKIIDKERVYGDYSFKRNKFQHLTSKTEG